MMGVRGILKFVDERFAMPLVGVDRISATRETKNSGHAAHLKGSRLTFFYSFDDMEEQPVVASDGPVEFDVLKLADENIQGWAYTGAMVGICCIDLFNKDSFALFHSFAYEGM